MFLVCSCRDKIEKLDNHYYKIKQNDKYGLIKYNKIVAEPIYDEVKNIGNVYCCDSFFSLREGDIYNIFEGGKLIKTTGKDYYKAIKDDQPIFKPYINLFFWENDLTDISKKEKTYYLTKDKNGYINICNENEKILAKTKYKDANITVDDGVYYVCTEWGSCKSINKLQAGTTHLKNGTIKTADVSVQTLGTVAIAPFVIVGGLVFIIAVPFIYASAMSTVH